MENLLALPCMVVAITHDVSGAFMKQFDKVYRVEHGSVTQA
jgi:ATP-binding cassette subfamily B protein